MPSKWSLDEIPTMTQIKFGFRRISCFGISSLGYSNCAIQASPVVALRGDQLAGAQLLGRTGHIQVCCFLFCSFVMSYISTHSQNLLFYSAPVCKALLPCLTLDHDCSYTASLVGAVTSGPLHSLFLFQVSISFCHGFYRWHFVESWAPCLLSEVPLGFTMIPVG